MKLRLLIVLAVVITFSSCKETNEAAEAMRACECNTYHLNLNDSSIIAVPSYFSPNNDGSNDEYMPHISATVDSFRFKVLNNNQEVLLNTDTLGVGWNGQVAGVDAGPGKYYFTLYAKFSNSLDTSISGNFCLVRDCITSNLNSGGCTTGSQFDGQAFSASIANGESFSECEE